MKLHFMSSTEALFQSHGNISSENSEHKRKCSSNRFDNIDKNLNIFWTDNEVIPKWEKCSTLAIKEILLGIHKIRIYWTVTRQAQFTWSGGGWSFSSNPVEFEDRDLWREAIAIVRQVKIFLLKLFRDLVTVLQN